MRQREGETETTEREGGREKETNRQTDRDNREREGGREKETNRQTDSKQRMNLPPQR